MDKQTEIYLTKIIVPGSSYSPNGGPRWTAQINGKFIAWRYKITEGEELLCLREAVLKLQEEFGSDADIIVKLYINSEIGYKNVPVEFYIENFDMDVFWFRRGLIEYQEQKVKEEKVLKLKSSTAKDFPFLMLDEEQA